MTSKIEFLLGQLRSREYRKQRKPQGDLGMQEFDVPGAVLHDFRLAADNERPILHENDDFGFHLSADCRFEQWGGSNVCPNYERVISLGFDTVKEQIAASMENTADEEKQAFGQAMLDYIDICLDISERYRECAREKGNEKLYDTLGWIPRKGARTFYEACVFMKMCRYFLQLAFHQAMGLGRFDQYMYPYYQKDRANGISDEEIFEILEGFFISLNWDSDLYSNVQEGDSGQSMVLGGFDKDGTSMYNELSQMCMEASLELRLIEPKINLRVGKNTPDDIFEFATQLTKVGLGFPQYCNDDVVVPGLLKLGYDYEDALNYVVAACWEYIVPNCGADVPNIDAMDFPNVVNEVIVSKLIRCKSFEELMDHVKVGIKEECDAIIARHWNTDRIWGGPWVKSPLLSVFMDGCIESLTDMWRGGTKYTNYGCHGAGIANAADALAAVKQNIFEEQRISREELLKALSDNFQSYEELRNLLKASPKMGNNDDFADDIACELMSCFSENLNNRDNSRNGIWRAGTGSAMEYVWKGEKCPSTADGRKAGEPYSSSFSPSLDVKPTGLLSVLQSFTKYDMTDIINGGPLTIEIHDTVLRNDVGIRKVAMLVKNYILLGGHQLQLNAVNRERLLDAQKHPEDYPNLVVRVWGWSGYFNDLDLKYQNHVIRRMEFES